jgi:anti-anti-sigma factor
MECLQNRDGRSLELRLRGKFTFANHSSFKPILADIQAKQFDKVELNLKELEFIDSAALGILLLLQEEIKKTHGTLTIRSPQGQVQKMLKIANFSSVFHVVD